jgi:hypothetical protein
VGSPQPALKQREIAAQSLRRDFVRARLDVLTAQQRQAGLPVETVLQNIGEIAALQKELLSLQSALRDIALS